jgi:hypothetical protein
MPKSIKMRQACSVECLFWLKTLLHKFTSGYNLIIDIKGPLARSDHFRLPLNRKDLGAEPSPYMPTPFRLCSLGFAFLREIPFKSMKGRNRTSTNEEVCGV